MMIWTLLLYPSEAVFNIVAPQRLVIDVHRLQEQLALYRSQCIAGSCGMDIQGLCDVLIPYAKCQWRGLSQKGVLFFADGRLSPGSISVRTSSMCLRTVVSSYGYIREELC